MGTTSLVPLGAGGREELRPQPDPADQDGGPAQLRLRRDVDQGFEGASARVVAIAVEDERAVGVLVRVKTATVRLRRDPIALLTVILRESERVKAHGRGVRKSRGHPNLVTS